MQNISIIFILITCCNDVLDEIRYISKINSLFDFLKCGHCKILNYGHGPASAPSTEFLTDSTPAQP